MKQISIEEALILGVKAHKAGNIQEADRYYTAILNVQPNHPDANHNMGVLAVSIKKTEKGLHFFEKALASNTCISQFWASYIDALLRLNRLDDAESALNNAKISAQFDKKLKRLQEELNELHRKTGIPEAAIPKTAEKHRAENGQLEEHQIKRLKILLNQDKYLKTLETLDKFVTVFPTDPNIYNLQGIAYAGLQDYKSARESYKKALEINDRFPEIHYNLGIALRASGETSTAIAAFESALKLKPDYIDAYNNLGLSLHEFGNLPEAINTYRDLLDIDGSSHSGLNNLGLALLEIGQVDEAIANFREAIKLCEDFVEAHFNLGNAFYKIGDLDQALVCYKFSLNLKPKSAALLSNIQFNMGIALVAKGELEEAISSYEKALKHNPNFYEAYYNMANTLYDQGKANKSVECFLNSLRIKPDYLPAWNNIVFSLLAAGKSKLDFSLLNYKTTVGISPEYVENLSGIVNFRCSVGTKEEKTRYLKLLDDIKKQGFDYVKNPKLVKAPSSCHDIKCNTVALVHFGRSGTGLLHSLIDGHPEVTTLPSIYLSEFFHPSNWQDLVSGGWEQLVNNFILKYDVLFDSRSSAPVLGKSLELITDIGKKEGMVNLGPDRNEFLTIDKSLFGMELLKLMSGYSEINQFTFFKLVHLAYNKAISDKNKKSMIFYHIHNPEAFTKLNFINMCPDVRWVMMVREPVQCCEAWILEPFTNNDYKSIVYRITTLLLTIDDPVLSKANAIGVRLEDLKLEPKTTISNLCRWLNIEENSAMYQMTAQGKKWWGDPTSPDYQKDGMVPFGKTSIMRDKGKVFSDKDQFVLNTIFYLFRIKFGYTNENCDKIFSDLKTIEPMLSQLFDFEKTIVKRSQTTEKSLMKSGSFKYLRSILFNRLRLCYQTKNMSNIIEPLRYA